MEETDSTHVVEKEMLTTSPTNLNSIHLCPSLSFNADEPRSEEREREDIAVSASVRCFLIHNFIAPEESSFLIEESEKRGFTDLTKDFDPTYRSNDRFATFFSHLH